MTEISRPKFFAATVLVFDATWDRILGVARRGVVPEDWGLPGGKIDPGESAYDAVREAFEETGVRVVLDPTPLYWGPDNTVPAPVNNCVTFLATSYTGKPTQQDGEPKIGWVGWDDIVTGVFGAYNTELRAAWLRTNHTELRRR